MSDRYISIGTLRNCFDRSDFDGVWSLIENNSLLKNYRRNLANCWIPNLFTCDDYMLDQKIKERIKQKYVTVLHTDSASMASFKGILHFFIAEHLDSEKYSEEDSTKIMKLLDKIKSLPQCDGRMFRYGNSSYG